MKRRTALFMPGNNPGFLINGGIHGADGIIFDLEDAVAPREKDAARTLTKYALRDMDYPCERLVRINDISTPYWKIDLDAVVPSKPDGIVLPKCERASDVIEFDEYITSVEERCGLPVGEIKFMCLIETCLGVRNAYEIASASKRVDSIALGCVDLTFDMGTEISDEGIETQYSRAKLLVDGRAAEVYVYDTSYTDVENIEGLIKWCKIAKQLGYDGRPVISPSHVEIVNEIFSPSAEEIAYAEEVVEAIEEGRRLGKGAVTLRGKMLDVPHIKRAEQILKVARQLNGGARK